MSSFEINYYAGIGSRETPDDVLKLMTKIAEYLRSESYILRSGGADGADSAFEVGAGDNKEIFLPWKNFNSSKNSFIEIPRRAFEIAAEFHPVWSKLKDSVKCLHARNVMQILGRDFSTLSSFVICWTKGGKLVGGTSQALRIAMKYEVPIFNLAIKENRDRLEKVVSERI